jgi:hypothetical protein
MTRSCSRSHFIGRSGSINKASEDFTGNRKEKRLQNEIEKLKRKWDYK